MPYKRPTPQGLLERIQTEFDLYLPGADARLRRSVENVLARALVIASHDLNGLIEYIGQQILVDTAEAEFLARHADIWGIARKQATKAIGAVDFVGTDDVVIPASTVMQRADGVQYSLDEDVTIASGVGTGNVTAVTAEAAGNAAAAVKLNLVAPISGIQTAVTVGDDGLTGGTDIETDASLSVRVRERIQAPPHGGNVADYKKWAKEVSGVTRAWAYPEQLGAGTVSLTFVLDDDDSSIIPSSGVVETVQEYIDAVRPVTADVTVFAPTAVPVDFEITLTPSSEAIKAAVQAELEDLFKREAEPDGTIYLSRINEAISTAEGEFDHTLTAPAADVDMDYGEMPVVGDFTWGGS